MMTDLFQQPAITGRELRESGVAQAERTGSEFVTTMRGVARQFALANGTVTADDLRRYADQQGIQPHHPNSWGAVFHAPEWVCVGRTSSRYATNHAREIRVWAFSITKPKQQEEVSCRS